MAKLYYKYNGVTCSTPNLTTVVPSGHYVAVNNGGTTYYQKLRAGTCAGVPNVNIGGTTYSFAYYPEGTNILVTPSFACKNGSTTCALCLYYGSTLLLNSNSSVCNSISIPDNATVKVCIDGWDYGSYQLQDGYLALNTTESSEQIYVSVSTSCSEYASTYIISCCQTDDDTCYCYLSCIYGGYPQIHVYGTRAGCGHTVTYAMRKNSYWTQSGTLSNASGTVTIPAGSVETKAQNSINWSSTDYSFSVPDNVISRLLLCSATIDGRTMCVDTAPDVSFNCHAIELQNMNSFEGTFSTIWTGQTSAGAGGASLAFCDYTFTRCTI